MKDLKLLAQEALDIQNACNSLGLTKRFAMALQDLSDNLRRGENYSTELINTHPITILWIDKLSSLAHTQFDGSKITDAFDVCYRLANQQKGL